MRALLAQLYCGWVATWILTFVVDWVTLTTAIVFILLPPVGIFMYIALALFYAGWIFWKEEQEREAYLSSSSRRDE